VIGGNGAGKSTLLNAIAGVWKPDFGTIEIDGVDVTQMPEYRRAKYLGRVFQDPMMGTAPDMEIAENLSLPQERGTKRRFVWGVRKEERVRYKELLATLEFGVGRSAFSQGRTSFRRSAAGRYAADGHAEPSEAASSGRAYGVPRPQDSRKSP
jgi:ABC-type uncharacterized transport system ATPase component